MSQYIVHRSDSDYDGDVLCHYGILGMKWGVRRNRQKSKSRKKRARKNNRTMGLDNRQARSYEEKVRAKIEEYNKQHPERSKKDNYTIALRQEERSQGLKMLGGAVASMAAMPLGGIGTGAGFSAFMANMFVNAQRSSTIAAIMDEYNIEGAERKIEL